MLTRVLRIIIVIVPEHASDTYVFTIKMEILLEPASNKLLVGDLRDSIRIKLVTTRYRFGPVNELTVDEF
ncbi:hypothetical protein Tco_0506973 [Tanacetum coccineum]